MTLLTKTAIGIGLLVIAAVALLGGVVRESFCRFVPDAPLSLGGFTLSIAPEFKGGSSGLVTVVPLLYHRLSESTRDPQVFVELTDNTLVRGYDDKTSITLSAVDVTNETGTTFSLIPDGIARTFPVDHSGFGHRREVLGAVAGERLTITAAGYTTDTRGTKAPFRQSSQWHVHRSSRTNLALLISE